MNIRLSAALAMLLGGCATRPLDPAPARIDHVIVGVADLDRGIAELERLTGVRAVVGGAHPGQGTRNALMSLGPGTYLELYAPNPAEPTSSKEVEELLGLSALKPLGWAISADEAMPLRALLQQNDFTLTASEPGSRRRPDGSVLHWQTFAVSDLDDPAAPFFILWAEPRLHPSRTSPGGCRLKRLDIQARADRLAQALRPLGLPVSVSVLRTPESSLAITLICPTGQLVLR
jgi:hypothetical protein